MRLRSLLNHAGGHDHQVNVTPMIDVIMCLIIFYLIVGKLSADQQVNVRLPQAYSGSEPSDERTLIISVLPAEGGAGAPDATQGVRMLALGRAIHPDELPALIRSRKLDDAETWVQVRADRSLGFGQIMPIVRACKDAGVSNLKLSVEPAS